MFLHLLVVYVSPAIDASVDFWFPWFPPMWAKGSSETQKKRTPAKPESFRFAQAYGARDSRSTVRERVAPPPVVVGLADVCKAHRGDLPQKVSLRQAGSRSLHRTIGHPRTRTQPAACKRFVSCPRPQRPQSGAHPIPLDAVAQVEHGNLGSVAEAELCEYRRDVIPHGSDAHAQVVGNLGVRQPIGDRSHHLAFAFR